MAKAKAKMADTPKTTAQQSTESNIFRGILQEVTVLVPLSSQRLKSIDSLDNCEAPRRAHRAGRAQRAPKYGWHGFVTALEQVVARID